MAVRILKDGKVLNTVTEDQFYGGAPFQDFAGGQSYYGKHGYQVERDEPPAGYQTPLAKLMDFGMGKGPAPQGLMKGYAAPPPTPGLAQTLSNGSSAATTTRGTLAGTNVLQPRILDSAVGHIPGTPSGTASLSGGVTYNTPGLATPSLTSGVNTSAPTTDLTRQLIDAALKIGQGPVTGLSPDAKAAMTTEAIESVPKRFDQAGKDLATSLRRRGGGLPVGGEFLQGYGPLLAEREATRAGLLRDITLADEEAKAKSQEFNTEAQLKALGIGSDLAAQLSNIDISKLDAETRTRIAEMGITSQEKIANMDDATRTKLAQMGIDSDMKLAQFNADLDRELTKLNINSAELRSKLDNETQMKLGELARKGDSVGLRIATSVGSSLLNNPAIKGAVDDGIGWVIDRIKGTHSPVEVASTGIPEAGPIGGNTGFGSKLAAFATNPWTIGIAAAAAGAFALYKKFGTDHLRANQIVQEFENPFAQTFIFPMHSEFFKAAGAGQLSGEQASAARSEFVSGWEEYVRQVNAWAGDDGSKKQVKEQSVNNLWPLIQRIVGDMDRVIQAGGHDHAMAA